MSFKVVLVAIGLLLGACSGGDGGADVPPLPQQTAETANALMTEAERAAAHAATRAETAARPGRSPLRTTNEVSR